MQFGVRTERSAVSQKKFRLNKNFQMEMIRMLENPEVRAMALIGFARVNGVIQPMLMVSEDFPDGESFMNDLYDLSDSYLNFKEVKEKSEEIKNAKS